MFRSQFLILSLLFVFPAALSKIFSDTTELQSPSDYDFIIVGGTSSFVQFLILSLILRLQVGLLVLWWQIDSLKYLNSRCYS